MKRILTYIILFSSIWNFVFSQNKKIDSLISLLKITKVDTIQLEAFNELSHRLRGLSLFDSALKCARNAKSIADNLLSTPHYKNEPKKQWTSVKEQLVLAHTNMGFIFRNQGNYPEALKNYLVGLKIREELGIKSGIANALINVGNVYKFQNNLPDALQYYERALKIFVEEGDKYKIALSHNNIGNIYRVQKKNKLALTEYFSALKIFKEFNDNYGLKNCYNNIGIVYESDRNYDEALKNHFAALKISEEEKDQSYISMSCGNIGPVLAKQKKFQEGIKYLNRSISIAKEIGDVYQMQNGYRAFSEIDSVMGNHKDEFTHYKLYIQYRDSLLNEENTKKTVEAQMNYEFEKKEAETKAEQDKKDLVAKEEKDKQQIVILSVSAGLILVLILALVIFRSLRQNQKKNKIITEQKEIVEKQKEIVEEKQKEILDSIHYARRIQRALITPERYIDKNLKRLQK